MWGGHPREVTRAAGWIRRQGARGPGGCLRARGQWGHGVLSPDPGAGGGGLQQQLWGWREAGKPWKWVTGWVGAQKMPWKVNRVPAVGLGGSGLTSRRGHRKTRKWKSGNKSCWRTQARGAGGGWGGGGASTAGPQGAHILALVAVMSFRGSCGAGFLPRLNLDKRMLLR